MDKRPRLDQSVITPTSDDRFPVYGSLASVTTLQNDIRVFETDSKVPTDLSFYVSQPNETLLLWYKELSKEWNNLEASPKTPIEATKLVLYSLRRVYTHALDILDIEDFLHFYRLPSYYSLPDVTPCGEASSVEAVDFSLNTPDLTSLGEAPMVGEDASCFLLLNTLPVTKNDVTNGFCFTVFVEVIEFYLLPSDILSTIVERKRALAKGETILAHELLKTINKGDYEVKMNNRREVVTKKYSIKLRGIEEIELNNVAEARDKLVKMVDGKCLTIAVSYIDDHTHCVGDVYCNGIRLQEKLLMGKSATCYDKTPGVS